MKCVPPGVVLAEGHGASDLVPVGLRVGKAGNALVLGGSADGPAGLGDPNGLACGGGGGVGQGLEEERAGITDGVGHGVLKVWVRVHADEVGVPDDCVVRSVDPCGPGVDVSDGSAAQRSVGNGGPDLRNVV